MFSISTRSFVALAAGLVAFGGVQAASLTFTKLTGVTGGSVANTAVYRADLSSLGSGTFASLLVQDGGVIGGSAAGQFSGFDLDAAVLSSTLCNDATCAQGLVPSLLNYGSMFFTPGTQIAPADAKLFGTGPAGTSVDNAVATIGSFDGESIAGPGADGFVSLGLGGSLAINLTSPSAVSGLYLYIGEVGDNGEVAGGNIELRTTPAVPEPETYALMLAGLGAIGLAVRRRKSTH